jgi:organic radical activating enzyme
MKTELEEFLMPTLSEKNPPYDAWLHYSVPGICNLSCLYCTVVAPNNIENRQSDKYTVKRIRGIIKKVFQFGIPTSYSLYRRQKISRNNKMPPIDVKALLKSLDRTGMIFRVHFTGGGEPLFIPNIVEACVALSKNHFLAFNTNLTSPRVREIAERVDPSRVVYFHASLHIKELERRNLLDRYIENYLICTERGFHVYAQVVGHPSLKNELGSYRKYFADRGIDLGFDVFKGEFLGKAYPESYTDEEIELFGLDQNTARNQYRQKGKLCNAGYNVVFAGPEGWITPCMDIPELLGHMYGGFKFQTEIKRCPIEICSCPFNEFDKPLFRLALSKHFGKM